MEKDESNLPIQLRPKFTNAHWEIPLEFALMKGVMKRERLKGPTFVAVRANGPSHQFSGSESRFHFPRELHRSSDQRALCAVVGLRVCRAASGTARRLADDDPVHGWRPNVVQLNGSIPRISRTVHRNYRSWQWESGALSS
jgi:hypothetical protein